MKIMIVDDHSGMRAMLRTLLAAPDVELSECTDGVEAIKDYRRFQPDWVLMDSLMKGMDGYSATREIISAFPEARVLLLSDDSATQLRRAARAAGAFGFVTKDDFLEHLIQHWGEPVFHFEEFGIVSTQS